MSLPTELPAELPGDATLDALVAADQLRFYFLSGSFPYAAAIGVAALYSVGVWQLLPQVRILAWLGAIVVVSGACVVTRRIYLRRQPDDTARWQRIAIAASILNGAVWGSVALVCYPRGSFVAQALLTLIVGGMCAGTFFLGGSYTTPSFAFVLLAMPPLAVRLLVDRDRQHAVMGGVLVLFAATMVMVARASCDGFKQAARLRFGLAALSRELARRADELEQFAGRVAHDICGPLSAATLGLDYAMKRTRQPEVHDVLGRIRRSTTRIGTIVDGLLRFARAGARPEPGVCTRVRPVLEGILGELAPLAEKADIELVLTLSCERALVVGHAGVLTSLVENLVRNALKYMGERPRKRIDVRVLEARDARRAFVRFEIEDSGPGIDPALLARLFDPHVRGHDTGQPGIGLGLATVKRISEAHGGRVGVRSTPGVGSIFWFELPQADGAADAAVATGAVGGVLVPLPST